MEPKSEKLIRLISDFCGLDPALLVDNSSLFHDFGVAGDDGQELLDVISKDFDIDIRDVDACRYFGPEAAYNPLYHLYCLLRGRKLDHDIIRLNIADLKRTVETGIWHAPES